MWQGSSTVGITPQALKSALETILAQVPMRLQGTNSKDLIVSSNGPKEYITILNESTV